jgi:hypothetical protein
MEFYKSTIMSVAEKSWWFNFFKMHIDVTTKTSPSNATSMQSNNLSIHIDTKNI